MGHKHSPAVKLRHLKRTISNPTFTSSSAMSNLGPMALPPIPSNSPMVNHAAMRRLEGHGMPCARPVDVFSSDALPSPNDSPTIKRYREPRILAPIRRRRPASPRRKSSAVYHTPMASPRVYKTAKGQQGVERALGGLMQNLKAAAASPLPRGKGELVSQWSDSERECRDDEAWFARSRPRVQTPAPQPSLPTETRDVQRADSMSLKRLAASIRSKSSLSSLRSVKSFRSKSRLSTAVGNYPSANASTWSFAEGAPGPHAGFSDTRPPPLPLPGPTAAVTLGPRPKSQRLQGLVRKLKRSRGPIPDFMPRQPGGQRHIPPGRSPEDNMTGSARSDSDHDATVRVASPMQVVASLKPTGHARETTPLNLLDMGRMDPVATTCLTDINNGHASGSVLNTLDHPHLHPRLQLNGAASDAGTTFFDASRSSIKKAKGNIKKTRGPKGAGGDGDGSRVEVQTVTLCKPVQAKSANKQTQNQSPKATNASTHAPGLASTEASIRSTKNNGSASDTLVPVASDDRRLVEHGRFMTLDKADGNTQPRLPSRPAPPPLASPITPTRTQRASTRPLISLTSTTVTTTVSTASVNRRRSLLRLISPTSPSFLTSPLSPLRRRKALLVAPGPSEPTPPPILFTRTPISAMAVPLDAGPLVAHPGSPTAPVSPLMPCNRPLNKAESILGVRLRRRASGFSFDRQRDGETPSEFDSQSTAHSSASHADSGDEEVLSFSIPHHGRRSTATFHTHHSASRPNSPPVSASTSTTLSRASAHSDRALWLSQAPQASMAPNYRVPDAPQESMAPSYPTYPSRTTSPQPRGGPSRTSSPQQWLSAPRPSMASTYRPQLQVATRTPDLSFESLSELSGHGAPSTPPLSPDLTPHQTGRSAVRAAVMAAAADPLKPRKLLNSLSGKRIRKTKSLRGEHGLGFRIETAPPLPPLPPQFSDDIARLSLDQPSDRPLPGATHPNSSLEEAQPCPDLGVPIAPPAMRASASPDLGAPIPSLPNDIGVPIAPTASLYSHSHSHHGHGHSHAQEPEQPISGSLPTSTFNLNDVISRNFAAKHSGVTALGPRPRPASLQVFSRAPATPTPIAPDARLPPHLSAGLTAPASAHLSACPRSARVSAIPVPTSALSVPAPHSDFGGQQRPPSPRWDEEEYNPQQEVAFTLLHSNASVHTFGGGARSHRESNASSLFEFAKARDVMDVDEDSDEDWGYDSDARTIEAY